MPAKKTKSVKKTASKKTVKQNKVKKTKTVKTTKSKTTEPKTNKETKTEAISMDKKTILSNKSYYFFGKNKAEGNATMRDLLGGKGANLAEMSNAGVPVPPGFTITTDVCRMYYDNFLEVPNAIDKEFEKYVGMIEKAAGMKFGDPENPLLVSVRSGSKFSMPGMMDTILNLGLNDEAVEGLGKKTGNMRFALDNYRRFIQMFGNVVLSIDKILFENVITKKKVDRRIKQDSSLQINDLKDISETEFN